MQTSQITILDYDLTVTPSKGWAKVGLFGQLVDGEYSSQKVEFQFTQYDAVTAAIELGFIEQPADRDEGRVGYEKPLFSATCRESLDYAKRIQYTDNIFVLNEFSGTDFAEQIARRLAMQAPEVRDVIQAEAMAEVLRNAPTYAVEPDDVARHLQSRFPKEFFGVVDLAAISEYIKHAWYAAEQETLNQL